MSLQNCDENAVEDSLVKLLEIGKKMPKLPGNLAAHNQIIDNYYYKLYKKYPTP
jgi:hypothetical protein